jgi:hypothetical protein
MLPLDHDSLARWEAMLERLMDAIYKLEFEEDVLPGLMTRLMSSFEEDNTPSKEILVNATKLAHKWGVRNADTHVSSELSRIRQVLSDFNENLDRIDEVIRLLANRTSDRDAADVKRNKVDCAICAAPTRLGCSGCRAIAYCGTACQAVDWTTRGHGRTCSWTEPILEL